MGVTHSPYGRLQRFVPKSQRVLFRHHFGPDLKVSFKHMFPRKGLESRTALGGVGLLFSALPLPKGPISLLFHISQWYVRAEAAILSA